MNNAVRALDKHKRLNRNKNMLYVPDAERESRCKFQISFSFMPERVIPRSFGGSNVLRLGNFDRKGP